MSNMLNFYKLIKYSYPKLLSEYFSYLKLNFHNKKRAVINK